MCCFSRPVQSVTNTNIFARSSNEGLAARRDELHRLLEQMSAHMERMLDGSARLSGTG